MITSGKVVIPAGTKVLCPKCKRTQAIVDQDLYIGSIISSEIIKPIPGSLLRVYRNAPALSYCCKIPFLFNGALFTSNGWAPYNPYPAQRPGRNFNN